MDVVVLERYFKSVKMEKREVSRRNGEMGIGKKK